MNIEHKKYSGDYEITSLEGVVRHCLFEIDSAEHNLKMRKRLTGKELDEFMPNFSAVEEKAKMDLAKEIINFIDLAKYQSDKLSFVKSITNQSRRKYVL